jgi:hypothetical protein
MPIPAEINNEIISNPGMGFQKMVGSYFDNDSPVTVQLDNQEIECSSFYFRFYWSGLETDNNDFSQCTEVINKVLDHVKNRGQRLAVRIMPYWFGAPSCFPSTQTLYSTTTNPILSTGTNCINLIKNPEYWNSDLPIEPTWTANAQTKIDATTSNSILKGAGNLIGVPDLTPLFRDRVILLLQAVKNALASDIELIDFIDIGLLGDTGEWAHPVKFYSDSALSPLQRSIALEIADSVKTIFPETYHVANAKSLIRKNGFGTLNSLKKMGWRIDHWGTQWGQRSDDWSFMADMNAVVDALIKKPFWLFHFFICRRWLWSWTRTHCCKYPVILEIGGSGASDLETVLENTTDSQANFDEQVSWSVESALYARASYIFLKGTDLLSTGNTVGYNHFKKLAIHLGYRIIITKFSISRRIRTGRRIRFSMGFKNAGVAICAPQGLGRRYEFAIRITEQGALNPTTRVYRTHRYADSIKPSTQILKSYTSPKATIEGFLTGASNGNYGVRQFVPANSRNFYFNYVRAPAIAGRYEVAIGLILEGRENPGVGEIRLGNDGIKDNNLGWWYPVASIEVK